MYSVSEAFLQAVQKNARRYYWTGKITTKARAVYPFGYEDIVKGSGYITAQCCGSSEIELGTVYAAEMLSVYTENDIETYRDVLYFVAQILGGFFCINREGKPWSSTLLGYRNVNGRYETVPEEAETVRMIFGWYLEGAGRDRHPEPPERHGHKDEA